MKTRRELNKEFRVMAESTLKRLLIEFLEKSKIFYTVVHQADRNGIPDIIVCSGGRFVGLELKTEGGHVSPLQARVGEKIEECGGRFHIVRPQTLEFTKQMLIAMKHSRVYEK